jgi:hypothetical protein
VTTFLYFAGKDDAEMDITPGGLLRQRSLKTAAYEAARRGRNTLTISATVPENSAIYNHSPQSSRRRF